MQTGDMVWSRHYGHPTPWTTAFRPLPLYEILAQTAARVPDDWCLDFMGRHFSYAEVLHMADRVAEGLQRLGLGKGDRVGLFLPNCPHYVAAYYGALRIGATLVNFSPLYNEEELAAQVADSGTETMFCLDVRQLFPVIESVLQRGVLKRLIVGDLAEVLPLGKSLLYRIFKRDDIADVPDGRDHVRFTDLIDNDGNPDPVLIDPVADVALLQYTGGTTGVPKGAILTHANLSINAQQVHAIDPEPHVPDRVLGVLPFFHIFANTCVLNRTILRGGEIVMLPKFELKPALSAIARRKTTAVPGVPTMYQALLDYPGLSDFDMSSIRVCISGGAPMPLELKQQFEALTGATIVEGYGLTESAGVVSANPYVGLQKSGSIGQPIPGTAIVIVDKDDPHRVLSPGEIGEITLIGPQLMRGYWNRPDADTDTIVDGRLRTGDVGYVDADGYVFIVDRLKDMLKVGGFNVYPSVLEAVLYRHPAVREALVIGIPDEYHGERPKAFVTLQAGATATADELMHFLNDHVGKHERAAAVEIRADLPKTMIGKLSRKELVREAREKAQAAGPAQP